MTLIRAAVSRILAAAPLLILLVTHGCGEVVSSGKDLQVRNETDLFRYQVRDLKNYSQTYSLVWRTSATNGVVVNQFSSISGGDATVVLKDASGTTIYTRSLKQNGEFTSVPGVPGEWTVQILLNKVSGSLLFQVEPF